MKVEVLASDTSKAVSVPLRGKEGAGLKAMKPGDVIHFYVSVPLRGKEGAGQGDRAYGILWNPRFPSPCGVRRVRDLIFLQLNWNGLSPIVSVPLRGKEGAGQNRLCRSRRLSFVSVPLRGKEGAGQNSHSLGAVYLLAFPSPCGVRRVRDVEVYPTDADTDAEVSVPLRGKEGAGPLVFGNLI